MREKDLDRFQGLSFEEFKKLAADPTLSRHEKAGFPDRYREGAAEAIFSDIRKKLTNLDRRRQVVLEIGPGCDLIPHLLVDLCRQNDHRLLLVDSREVLVHLPDEPFLEKHPGQFPMDSGTLLDTYSGKVNVLVVYSVIHYVFAAGGLFDFVDRALCLLAEGGQMLIGDVPNISQRKRFFASASGVRFHKAFMQTDQSPDVRFNRIEPGHLDDAVMLSLVLRARLAGFHAYLLPQPEGLPMANRREDLLFVRP